MATPNKKHPSGRRGGARGDHSGRGMSVVDTFEASKTLQAEASQSRVPLDTPDVLVFGFRLAHVNDLNTSHVGSSQTSDTVLTGTVIDSTSQNRRRGTFRSVSLVDRQVVISEDRNATIGGNFRTTRQSDNFVDRSTTQSTEQTHVATPWASVPGDVVNLTVFVGHVVQHLVHVGARQRGTIRTSVYRLARIKQCQQAT